MAEPPLPLLSIVAPAYQEHDNLPVLLAEIAAIEPDLRALGWRFETIIVDDGSSPPLAAPAGVRYPWLEVMRVPHLGLTGALFAGVAASRGELIATLDADLQNDPADIPPMVDRLLATGADVVAGVRATRRDDVARRLSSRVANRVRRAALGDTISDAGCTLRVFRAAVRSSLLPPFNGAHRFINSFAVQAGLKVVEHPTHHRPRHAGVSHFGLGNRFPRVLYDLLGVMWLTRRKLAVPPHKLKKE